MVQSKIRLKFRVHGTDGVSSDGIPTPSWTEKWGVSLFDYEEFHVTDHLLKLPFREDPPKTVCIFSLLGGSLSFRMLDLDRVATVSGQKTRQALLGQGEEIRIGDLIRIEVVQAPPKKVFNQDAGPTLSTSLEIIPQEEEGPTLTLVPTETSISVAAKIAAEKSKRKKKEIEEEDRTPTNPSDLTPKESELVFKEIRDQSVEVQEPSIRVGTEFRSDSVSPLSKTVPDRPASLQSNSKPKKKISLIDEPKVELAHSPHSARDETFRPRRDSVIPVPTARLGSGPSWSERIIHAVSRIVRREDLDPVEEPFVQPGGREHETELESVPDRPVVTGLAPPEARRKPVAWVPQPQSRRRRLTLRSFFFLLGAALSLYVAVDFLRIQIRIHQQSQQTSPSEPEKKLEFKKGMPIEFLEIQLERLRR